MTENLFGTVGLARAYLGSPGRGTAAMEQHIVYQREVLARDTVYVHSDLLKAREKAALRAPSRAATRVARFQ
ncbi:hypothetical protein [Catellatospora methionotrophica]|uniref:hypothetical protein n=1 Tax=Catellatospora methionotrophica TaxID=121620 RepID=UPI00140DB865|nr:hypothetical protein [Catellatospora methionotrophica]